MATPTVDHSRVHSLVRRIARLDAEPARLEAVALGLVDGVLDGDNETLAAALDALRDARARATGDQELVGWLDAAIAFAHWGLERAPSRAAVAQGTQAHDFLRVLDGSPQLGSAELRRLLEVDETQVSRTGRRLLESGLVTRRKVGRQVFWRLTPRGQRALEEAPAPKRSRNSEFWQEALRRGFEAAAGDEPGEPRQVDPTRERIIESTLELHSSRGIQATTWAEIAGKAGVPVETVKALFPTQGRPGQKLRRALHREPAAAAARPSARSLRRRLVGERATPPPGRDVLRRLRARSGRHYGCAPRAQGCPGGGRVDGSTRQHLGRPRRRGAAPTTLARLLGRLREGAHRPRGMANPA